MKKHLLIFFILTSYINIGLAQSGDFNCEEDTAFQTKFIVGSANHVIDIPRATGFLNYYAEKGCITAQLKLAEVYGTDKYGIFDAEKACFYATMATRAGSEEGKQLLLKYYKNEIGCNYTQDDLTALMDCNEKTEIAYRLFKGSPLVVAKEKKAFKQLTKYAKEGCAEAQYIVGKYAKKGFRDKIEINYDKSFKFLRKAARQGHPRAHAHLGQLYERGYGCDLNYKKARKLFKTAYELGDGMGAYCIGYNYLRGMGNVDQSYSKAISWFEKSDYQMATHWLAVMNYFGYGMPVNKDKAIELLVNNEGIYNSPRLLEHLEAHKDDPNTILGDFKQLDISAEEEQVNTIFKAQTEGSLERTEITSEHIAGDWTGKLVELDFASERIVREFPIEFNLKTDEIKDVISYTANINEGEYAGEGILLDDELYFNDLSITLPKLYKDNLIDDLSLKILSADLEIKELNHVQYLTALVESKELNWNEKGTPLLLVLANTEMVTDNDVVIDSEIINDLLNAQGGNFITLFPNPFQNDLLIQYDLINEAYTTVEIQSLHGMYYKKVVDNELQPEGEKLYFIDGTGLDKGYYAIKVTVNQQVHSKLIIKE